VTVLQKIPISQWNFNTLWQPGAWDLLCLVENFFPPAGCKCICNSAQRTLGGFQTRDPD